MNLLPEEEKARIGQERLRRLFAVALWMCALAVWIGVVLLLPSYFFVELERREFLRGLEGLKSSPEIARIERDERETEALRRKFALLEAAFAFEEYPSPLLEAILAARPLKVSILDISYGKGEKNILVKGRARTRGALLEFSRALETREEFGKATSPVSNFLKEQDLEFSLSVELVGGQ